MNDQTPARMLWDHSGLWGLMTLESCRSLGLPVQPITAAEIKENGLGDGCGLLVVPGGWPSLRRKALGDEGAEAIRNFVSQGGRYLGFCGGGGLALNEKDGLGLIPMGRCRGKGRVQSVSGPIVIQVGEHAAGHPIWHGLGEKAVFHVWFPGQFSRDMPMAVETLGDYSDVADGLHCSDVAVGSLSKAELLQKEKDYGIRLDPAALMGRAAIIEAPYGRGKVIASYAHLDTNDDPAGGLAMQNLWRHWAEITQTAAIPQPPLKPHPAAARMASQAAELWHYGERLGLWRPRHPQVPLWRRGARGLEFWTLVRFCGFFQDHSAPDTDCIDWQELQQRLEPVWSHGEVVLQLQAQRLEGAATSPEAERTQEQWFPAPRRMGGALLSGIKALENMALRLIRDC